MYKDFQTVVPPGRRSQAGLKPKAETATPIELNGGLVVYEHGKVVFRMGRLERNRPPTPNPASRHRGQFRRRRRGKMTARLRPQPASSPTANSYLLARVEPQYPEAARQQHIKVRLCSTFWWEPTVWFGKPA